MFRPAVNLTVILIGEMYCAVKDVCMTKKVVKLKLQQTEITMATRTEMQLAIEIIHGVRRTCGSPIHLKGLDERATIWVWMLSWYQSLSSRLSSPPSYLNGSSSPSGTSTISDPYSPAALCIP